MRTSRISRAWIALLIGTITWVLPLVPTAAQVTDIRLRLVSQTPWTTLDDPILRLKVHATNGGDRSFEDLSVGLALGAAIRARNEYEETLIQGPPFVVFAPAPTAIDGPLDPGEERSFRLEADVSDAVSSTDSLIYPTEVTLFSADRPVASLSTPLLHIVREPEVPVPLSWWVTLAAGPVLSPDRRLADPSFEAAIATEGRIAETVEAIVGLSELSPRSSVGLIIEPLLLDQLREMADGYERLDGARVEKGTSGAADAASVLAGLRAAASDPWVKLILLPYAAPQLPAMIRSGLVDDLVIQYELGEEVAREVLGRGGGELVVAASEDALDDAALSFLALRGATVVLAGAETVARPEQPNLFAPPPTASVPLAGGGAMSLVLPDPGTQALLERADLRDDPVRLAQAVLGELAVIWREQPVPIPPAVRGLALALPPDLPPAAWASLTRRIAGAPFLRGVPAETLVASVDPAGDPAALASPSNAAFSIGFSEDLRAARNKVEAFEQILVGGSEEPARLLRDIAVAEAGGTIGSEAAGRGWLDAVTATTQAEFERVAPLPHQVFTLTSEKGTILIRFGDPGVHPHRVVVQLQSSWFRFPDGAAQAVTLDGGTQPVPFTVRATATGRRPIRVLVRAGAAGPVVAAGDVVVGSTAANRVALIVAGAAALGLVGLWARRLVRRTKT